MNELNGRGFDGVGQAISFSWGSMSAVSHDSGVRNAEATLILVHN